MELQIGDEKILRCFRKIWASIPQESQEHITRYLTLVSDRPEDLSYMTGINIANESNKGAVVFAMSEFDWYKDSYNVVILRSSFYLSEDKLRYVLLHELAHVFCRHKADWINEAEYSREQENEADELVSRWGGQVSTKEDLNKDYREGVKLFLCQKGIEKNA